MALYLLHFSTPFRHAKHYLGFADDVESIAARIERHKQGRGATLTKHVVNAGIELVLARTWPDGDRALERRLKNGGSSTRFCPICRGHVTTMRN